MATYRINEGEFFWFVPNYDRTKKLLRKCTACEGSTFEWSGGWGNVIDLRPHVKTCRSKAQVKFIYTEPDVAFDKLWIKTNIRG